MSNLKKHISLSRLAKLVLLFVAIGILSNVIYKHFSNYKVQHLVIGSDMEGYYQYLPYVLLKDTEDIKRMGWAKPFEEGKTLNVFTSGVAIMQFPFFIVAHGITKFLNMEANGYGPVYFISVLFATLFYVLLGLIFLYKLLLKQFSHKISLLGVALLFYATNLFYYTIMSPGMSHAYSFSLIAVFIYFVSEFYGKPTVKNTLIISFTLALATLIRPTNFVIVVYFILYDILKGSDIKNRFLFYFKRWYLLVLMVFVGVLTFLPQMLYWHYVTGKFIYYSYQSETFTNFLSPKIITVLFGQRNGWFLYTPLMLIAVLGLFILVWKKKLNGLPILIILLIIIYLNGSWWLPTFSAAAGYRAMIEYLPFMVIPLTWVLYKVWNHKNRVLRISFWSILILFVIYNLLFSYKYASGYWWDTEWTWSHFLKLVKF